MLVYASQISKGQLSDINTLSSLLFTTKFSCALQFQSHIELFSTFFDESRQSQM